MLDLGLIAHYLRGAVPQAEMDGAQHLLSLFSDLTLAIERFEAALDLLDHSEGLLRNIPSPSGPNDKEWPKNNKRRQAFVTWLRIATNDAAMTVWDISILLNAIKHAVGKCPSIVETYDGLSLRKALRDFETTFPQAEKLRHAIAHKADMRKSPAEAKKHALQESYEGPGAKVGAGNTIDLIMDRQITISKDGKALTLDVTREKHQCLVKVREAIAVAFLQSVKTLQKRKHPGAREYAEDFWQVREY